MRYRKLSVVLLVVVMLASACTNNSADADPAADQAAANESTTTASDDTATTVAVSSTTSAVSTDVAGTEGPARVQVDWVVEVLNAGGPTIQQVEERFSPAFLSQIPAEQIVGTTSDVFAIAEPPYLVERFEASPDGLSGEATLLGSDNRRMMMGVTVAAVSPHQIEGLGFLPAELEFPLPVEIDAIDRRLAEFGPQSALGLYDVTSGDCVAVNEVRAETPIVLGSTFKLWVLAALAFEIEAGRATWDETVVVTDELRSNPSGEIYELETGTEVTLERLAELMIGISDNTATDLLLDRLGRVTVEEALERIGVADVAANVPMLSTGNLFALKYVLEPPSSDDYRSLDEAGKRALLADLDGAVLGELVPGEPRDLDIEWFATAADLCRTLVHLDELANTAGLEQVASILEPDSGLDLPFDRERLATIRFKGGSEAGVLAGAWWFETVDGERYVVAGGVANPDAAINSIDAILTIASAIELIE